jgi:hypothetical protein
MKHIAIVCFSNYVTEPRVLRTIEALKQEYRITLFSADKTISNIQCENIAALDVDREEINFHHKFPALVKRTVAFMLKIGGYSFQSKNYFKRQYWSEERKNLLHKIDAGKYDLVIGHGIYTLPILAALKTKTVFNAHEYYFKEFEEDTNWRKYTQPYYKFILDEYLSEINLMFCVSKLIQDEYQKHFQINSVVVTNATKFQDLEPTEVGTDIKIIHHGGAIRTRQLELMAEMMNYLPETYSLTFMLTPSDAQYLGELKELSRHQSNIMFIEPVPVNQIAETCNRYDVGLFILPPVNFNWYYALPNKLFEFIQGRLCIAVSPNPDMKRVVEENQLGLVATDYTAESMAKEFAKLTREKIIYHKQQSHICAGILNAGQAQKLILEEVKKLLNECAE